MESWKYNPSRRLFLKNAAIVTASIPILGSKAYAMLAQRMLMGTAGVPTMDPGNDANTLLLLNMDGVDDAQTFTDTSVGGTTHNMTAVNQTLTDTAQKVFGTASAYFDGTTDSITTLDSADFTFGAGDWTVDFRVRWNSSVARSELVGHGIGANNYGWAVVWATNELLLWYTTDGTNGALPSFAWTPAADTWYHVAVVRNGNDLKGFVDGVQKGSTADMTGITIYNSTDLLRIGYVESFVLDGWIDELRISNVARWTSNFTVPDQAYYTP